MQMRKNSMLVRKRFPVLDTISIAKLRKVCYRSSGRCRLPSRMLICMFASFSSLSKLNAKDLWPASMN